MKSVISILIFLLAGVANASTITINFEDQALGDTAPVSVGFTLSGGFQNTGGAYETYAEVALGNNGTQVFQVDSGYLCNSGGCGAAGIVLEAIGGGGFSFYGADVYFDDLNNGYSSLDIFGLKTGGGFFSGGTFGTGDWLDVQQVIFRATSDNGIGIFTPILEVDNIAVGAAVPIPAAVWLLGSALAGLGFLRRRGVAP